MSEPVATVPVTCCGRDGQGCVCAKEATCSCGKKAALHCDCEKSSTENKITGARCSCSTFYSFYPYGMLCECDIQATIANIILQTSELRVSAPALGPLRKTPSLERHVLVESVRIVSPTEGVPRPMLSTS